MTGPFCLCLERVSIMGLESCRVIGISLIPSLIKYIMFSISYPYDELTTANMATAHTVQPSIYAIQTKFHVNDIWRKNSVIVKQPLQPSTQSGTNSGYVVEKLDWYRMKIYISGRRGFWQPGHADQMGPGSRVPIFKPITARRGQVVGVSMLSECAEKMRG